MTEATERDYQMAGDFAGEGWLRDIDREETLVQLARYFAKAREEGWTVGKALSRLVLKNAREEGRQEERLRCARLALVLGGETGSVTARSIACAIFGCDLTFGELPFAKPEQQAG